MRFEEMEIEKQLEERILKVKDESEAKLMIEGILAWQTLPFGRERMNEIDIKGNRYFEEEEYHEALVSKTMAARCYELSRQFRKAGFSFDRGANAAHHLDWSGIAIILCSPALVYFERVRDYTSLAHCNVRMAGNYYNEGKVGKAEDFLITAEIIARDIGLNLNDYKLYWYLKINIRDSKFGFLNF